VIVQRRGRVDYAPTWHAMQAFTASRTSDTADELWLCEHPPVFTQGLAGRPEHLLRDIGVPVVQIDRGGQITYHGPGQVVVYLLVDLRRRQLTVKTLVNRMEQAVIDLLADYRITAARLPGAPGVYVDGAKIAALGLKVKNGCCYHGISLNVAMDLTPFSAINPCGYEGMRVTQLAELGCPVAPAQAGEDIVRSLIRQLEQKATPRKDPQ
jgi:lipoyl(octanoyl) transferase